MGFHFDHTLSQILSNAHCINNSVYPCPCLLCAARFAFSSLILSSTRTTIFTLNHSLESIWMYLHDWHTLPVTNQYSAKFNKPCAFATLNIEQQCKLTSTESICHPPSCNPPRASPIATTCWNLVFTDAFCGSGWFTAQKCTYLRSSSRVYWMLGVWVSEHSFVLESRFVQWRNLTLRWQCSSFFKQHHRWPPPM